MKKFDYSELGQIGHHWEYSGSSTTMRNIMDDTKGKIVGFDYASEQVWKSNRLFSDLKHEYEQTFHELKREKQNFQKYIDKSKVTINSLNEQLSVVQAKVVDLNLLKIKKEKENTALKQELLHQKGSYEQLVKDFASSEQQISSLVNEQKTTCAELKNCQVDLLKKDDELKQNKQTIEEQDAQIQLVSQTNLALMQQIEEMRKAHADETKKLKRQYEKTRLSDRQEMFAFMSNINEMYSRSAASSVVSSQANSPESSPLSSPRHLVDTSDDE